MVRKSFLIAMALMIPTGAAMAQDMAPVLGPGEMAEGIYARQRMGGYGKQPRSARSATGTTARQRQACANLPNFRQQYGADNPKVQKLTSLCEAAGY